MARLPGYDRAMTTWLNGRLRPSSKWLIPALGIPALLSLLAAGWGLPGVLASGMCPPAPPDIPAYPCSPLDYVLRVTLGPWALPGHLLIWITSLSLMAASWLLVGTFRRKARLTNWPSGRKE
jgi:hypothetical protein